MGPLLRSQGSNFSGTGGQMRKRNLFKIGASEFAKVFARSDIINYGSVELGIERAEEEALVVNGDSCTPFFCGFDEIDAFVF